ncbi:unnamed protein product [Meloidogyne enterolobii]|uniref:Uncharacterized protein n=1 Tax=Meloidogyne enterolobii TaxID=390850 RepID=A0ACB1A5Q9_MELEN
MWPPPRHNMPIPPPPIQPYGMPLHGHPPDPYMDRRVGAGAPPPPLAGPQWNHREVGTWRVPGEDWRSAVHHQPWSKIISLPVFVRSRFLSTPIWRECPNC